MKNNDGFKMKPKILGNKILIGNYTVGRIWDFRNDWFCYIFIDESSKKFHSKKAAEKYALEKSSLLNENDLTKIKPENTIKQVTAPNNFG